MSALKQERNTPQYGVEVMPQLLSYPVAAGVHLYQGGLAVLKGGYVEPGQSAADLITLGRVEQGIDNTQGQAGEQKVLVRQGVFLWNNSADGEAVRAQDVGADCYVVDDQTVARTDGNDARSRAGKVVQVEPQGVWVLTGIGV